MVIYMNKSYIRLNDNDNHLSIGNIFRVIKELSKNKASALQSEIFCVLFNIDFINEIPLFFYFFRLISAVKTLPAIQASLE